VLPTEIAGAFTSLRDDGRGGKGVVVVYAAGNGDNDMLLAHPALCSDDTVIVVGNTLPPDTDGCERRKSGSRGSNYGIRLDLCAQGEDCVTIGLDPNVSISLCEGSSSQGVDRLGGTSAAAALVTGAVALVLSANESLSALQVKRILTDSASKIDESDGAWLNGFSISYGFGRLHVGDAVRRALPAAVHRRRRLRSRTQTK
jgi:subtilisin family serine protease